VCAARAESRRGTAAGRGGMREGARPPARKKDAPNNGPAALPKACTVADLCLRGVRSLPYKGAVSPPQRDPSVPGDGQPVGSSEGRRPSPKPLRPNLGLRIRGRPQAHPTGRAGRMREWGAGSRPAWKRSAFPGAVASQGRPRGRRIEAVATPLFPIRRGCMPPEGSKGPL
jgi:hypothetical protein